MQKRTFARRVRQLLLMVVPVLASGLAQAIGMPKDMPRKVLAGLPEGYTQLIYVDFSGQEAVNSGYTAAATDSIVVDFRFDGRVGNYNYLFGCRTSLGFWSFLANGGNPQYQAYNYGGETAKLDSPMPVGPRVILTCKEQTVSHNGKMTVVEVTPGAKVLQGMTLTTTGPSTATSSCPMAIGGNNRGSDGGWTLDADASGNLHCCKMRLYSFRIYDANGVLKCDMIPCKSPEGVVGLYDMVTPGFHANASGKGALVAGPEVVCEERLEYVSFSTGNEVVNSGYVADIRDWFSADLIFDKPDRNVSDLFGCRDSEGARWYFMTCYKGNNQANYSLRGKDGWSGENVIFPVDKRVKVTCKGQTATWPGGSATTPGTLQFGGSQIAIGAMNNGGSGQWSPVEGCKMKLYSFKIYDYWGALMVDMIPCRVSESTVVLCDTVTGRIHENLGSGALVAGPALTYERLKYAKFSGSEAVNSGYIPLYDDSIVVDFRFEGDAHAGKNLNALFGCRDEANSKWAFYCLRPGWGAGYTVASSDKWGTAAEPFPVNERVVLTCTGQTATWPSGSLTSAGTPANGGSLLAIGTWNYNGGHSDGRCWNPQLGEGSKMSLYSFKILDANEMPKLELIPCRLSDGRVTLVDLVSERVCDVDGELVAGPVKIKGFMAIIR